MKIDNCIDYNCLMAIRFIRVSKKSCVDLRFLSVVEDAGFRICGFFRFFVGWIRSICCHCYACSQHESDVNS